MTNVKRITLITVCLAAILPGNGLWAQQTEATGTTQTADSVSIPRNGICRAASTMPCSKTSASVVTGSMRRAHR